MYRMEIEIWRSGWSLNVMLRPGGYALHSVFGKYEEARGSNKVTGKLSDSLLLDHKIIKLISG